MQAYQQLFEAYWDQVYGAGLHLTKSPELAKDFAQDVFLRLWDNRTKLSDIRNFGNYLYVITKNIFHDYLRTKTFRESNKEFLLAYFDYNVPSPHERLEQKEMNGVLKEAINKLPPKLRQVFILCRLEGLSHEDIARKLNISPFSSKTYVTRALIILRKQISKNRSKLLLPLACL